MNNQLIEKVIMSSNDYCPELIYDNPLLDREVAKALSKSFVKILNLSKQNPQSNNNLRLSVLENIRRMCQIEPENHVQVDESMTELLSEVYQKHIDSNISDSPDNTDKVLDAFLLKKMKELGLHPNFESSQNPEILQALLNLNDNKEHLYALYKEVIHWNVGNKKYMNVLRHLWNNNFDNYFDTSLGPTHNDISLKMKLEIEKFILEECYNLLSNRNMNIENCLSRNNSLCKLIKTCSVSPICFQISSSILNFIFIKTNFNAQIQKFISIFILDVKSNCNNIAFSTLYPIHLSNIVLLLDIELAEMPLHIKSQYIKSTIDNLKEIHESSENEFILLLSHFPLWFDIYYEQVPLNCNEE